MDEEKAIQNKKGAEGKDGKSETELKSSRSKLSKASGK